MAITELLDRKGVLTDTELFDLLKERYSDVGFAAFNKVLMRLEVRGRIHVSSLVRGKRRVELKKRE
ncbi:MAG: hypothetical protein JSV58_03330 [Candidatus Bathyarchaeota archaeon]|nr:MAG: hypothetical protein JSV58_03330 [Candidatus Bathyarchaeota archaeon]